MLLGPKEALSDGHVAGIFWSALIFLFSLLFLMLGFVVVRAFYGCSDELNIRGNKGLRPIKVVRRCYCEGPPKSLDGGGRD